MRASAGHPAQLEKRRFLSAHPHSVSRCCARGGSDGGAHLDASTAVVPREHGQDKKESEEWRGKERDARCDRLAPPLY